MCHGKASHIRSTHRFMRDRQRDTNGVQRCSHYLTLEHTRVSVPLMDMSVVNHRIDLWTLTLVINQMVGCLSYGWQGSVVHINTLRVLLIQCLYKLLGWAEHSDVLGRVLDRVLFVKGVGWGNSHFGMFPRT